MFNKSFLVDKVVNSLLAKEFQVFVTQGCFDIAARREYLMLVKALTNVDGLSKEQALSLRSISYFLSAYPLVVSVKNNRELLSNEMIYSRFQIPVATPKMFDNILDEESPAVQSAKGRHTQTINSFVLREKRVGMQLTLEELSRMIGISKKALYEIENNRVSPTVETVKKLESVLGVDLKTSYELRIAQPEYLKPKNDFQREVSHEFARIGIDNSSVYSAPFEIVGKEKFSLITSLSKNTRKIKTEAVVVKRLSSIFLSKAVFIAKKSHEKTVEGIPVVLESELQKLESIKELSEIIES